MCSVLSQLFSEAGSTEDTHQVRCPSPSHGSKPLPLTWLQAPPPHMAPCPSLLWLVSLLEPTLSLCRG